MAELAREYVHDALDEKVPEADPFETGLCVRDRVEDRRLSGIRLEEGSRGVEERLYVVGRAP